MTVQGVDKLFKKLSELEGKVEKKICRRGLRAGAKVTLPVARSNAPRKSGLVAASIKVRAGKSRKGVVRIIVGVGKKWFTGSTFYAAFVAFGHRIGPRRLGDARAKQPANDFLARAYDSTKGQAASTATETMWAEYKAEL